MGGGSGPVCLYRARVSWAAVNPFSFPFFEGDWCGFFYRCRRPVLLGTLSFFGGRGGAEAISVGLLSITNGCLFRSMYVGGVIDVRDGSY